MKRTGIMGGTFDPPHLGHLAIAKSAKEQFALDEVLFIPSGTPYMKKNKKILPGLIRMEMTELAVADIPFFSVSSIEIEKEGNTYTYETLQDLRKSEPETEYFFIMGADSLWSIENWKEPGRIFADCRVLAAIRDDKSREDMEAHAAYLKEKFAADISLLQTEQIEVSSSMIRHLCEKGNVSAIRAYVPDTVYQYILRNQLYQE